MAGGGATTAGRSDLVGLALVVASALSYSTLGIFGKIAYAEGLTLRSLLATRFTIAAAALWCGVALLPGLRGAARRLPASAAVALLLWGVLGFAAQSALFFSALERISASLAIVLLYTCPAFLAILLWLTRGRRPARSRLSAIALAMAGTALCVGLPAGGGSAAGIALGVLAGFWYAMFALVMDRLARRCPGTLAATWVITGAALTWGAAGLLFGWAPPPTARAWGAVLGMVTAATLFGFVLYVMGLKRVGPQAASILSTFEPVGTLALAGFVLGERLAPGQWGGAALIIAAAAILAAISEPGDRLPPAPAVGPCGSGAAAPGAPAGEV